MRRGFWLRFAEFILRPLLNVFTKRTWRGWENVPVSGPAIFVANHTSMADPLVIAHFLYDRPREMRVLVKSSLFSVPLVGTVLRSSGQIPVHRATRTAGDALRTAAARIRAGEAPLIYPEGTVTRDPDLWPMQGKTGAARLFLDTGAPVIPIVQWGAHNLHDYRTGKVRLRPRTPVTVSAGAPIDLSAFVGSPPTGVVLKEMTDVIMRRLRDDLAELRGEPAPTGPLHVSDEKPRGLAS
ncbi:lysophospholipid acyltransferase family protein [Cryptosporangium sp. NPDC048952]|uniref:lysophospholipid acyltransferase family protein n=1 Tax=Cryptosporangium sp. NPDC048952 TaxID=3363961 RepID=UPI00371699BE